MITLTTPADLFMPLPLRIEDMDAGWTTQALRQYHPGITVHSCEVVDIRNGTCTKIRVRLDSDDDALPETLIIKGGFEPHSRDWHYMHQVEVHGYRDILPVLGLTSPECHFAAYDADRLQGIIAMEDLVSSGVRFCHALRPEGYEATRDRLSALARFHAAGWQDSRFAPGGEWSGWMRENLADTRDYAVPFLKPEVWNHYMALPRGAAVSKRFHDAAWLGDALDRLSRLSATLPHCVLHGDTHPGNLYVTKQGEPGFFDSLPTFGPPMSEVSYHLVCALDIADRREWEAPLVRHYLAELASHGIAAPDFDEAMAQYGAFLARAWFIFAVNASEFQDEAVNTAYTTRISAAMLDHDTIGRIAAIE